MNPADSAAVAIRGASLAFHRKDHKLEPVVSVSSPSSPNDSHSRAQSLSRDIHGAYTAAALSAAGHTTTTSGRIGNSTRAHTGTAATTGPTRNEGTASLAGWGPSLGVDPPGPQQHQQPQGIVAARLHQLGHQQRGESTATAGAAQAAATSSSTTAAAAQAAHLGLAAAVGRTDAKSPSLIAATLAASRSVSPMPVARMAAANTGVNTSMGSGVVRRAPSVGAISSAASSASAGEGALLTTVDSESIPPTGTLISVFERPRDSHLNEKAKGPLNAGHGRTKSKSGKRPPTPPSRNPNPSASTDWENQPLTTPVNVRPAVETFPSIKPSKPKPRSSTTDWPNLTPTLDSPMPSRSNPSSASQTASNPQPVEPGSVDTRSLSPPQLSSSRRRPMTPSSIPNSTEPSTPAPSSKRQMPLPNEDMKSSIAASGPKPQLKTSRASSPKLKPTAVVAGLQPSTPPPLKPLMSRSMAEVLSPQPQRMSMSSAASPHLTLSPAVQPLSPPSPDPLKRSPTTKRPPTPPKPRGSIRSPSRQDQHNTRGRERSHSETKSAYPIDNRLHIETRPIGKSVSPTPKLRAEQQQVPSLPARKQSIASAPSSPLLAPTFRRRQTTTSVSGLQLDNLTDAIVAGSLASSRLTPHNTGPSTIPPNLPKRQRSPRMLQTLRQPLGPSDDEADRHRKGHRPKLHKHKHAHHEGSRKKWREEIRPRERKRYEALWASNRGTLLTSQNVSPSTSVGSGINRDISQYVVNIVVREIWKRSRLPLDELAEIWDLVDREKSGMLGRQEFVVGTWLVDQRLKGRKVPQKVTDSVWGSANGLTIKRPK